MHVALSQDLINGYNLSVHVLHTDPCVTTPVSDKTVHLQKRENSRSEKQRRPAIAESPSEDNFPISNTVEN